MPHARSLGAGQTVPQELEEIGGQDVQEEVQGQGAGEVLGVRDQHQG